MSSTIGRGVLRAVRLLPDVVKIGVLTEPALPVEQKEEQVLNVDVSEGSEPISPEKELNDTIDALRSDLAALESSKAELESRLSSMESELAQVRQSAAQKEEELRNSVDEAREKARGEGREQGHAEGRDSGYEVGLEQARREMETEYGERFSKLAETLEGFSSRLESSFGELVALNQPRMIRLWQEMLEKMLQREVALDPEGILDVLADVLTRLSDKNHILIYVSPEDLGLLQDRVDSEFEDILRGVRHLELKSDTNVDSGSCIVETNLGVYDARWRTQLDQIDTAVDKLFQKLGKPPKVKTRSTVKKTADDDVSPESEASEVRKKKTVKKSGAAKTVRATTKTAAQKAGTETAEKTTRATAASAKKTAKTAKKKEEEDHAG